MAEAVGISVELRECLNELRFVLNGYIRTVDGLIAVAIGDDSASHIRQEKETLSAPLAPVLALMLQAVGSSSHTLDRLSDSPGLHTRDCYSITRSVVELATNICYVMAEGPSSAEGAHRHARQKAFRDLERRSEIGNSVIQLAFSDRPDPSSIKGLEDDLSEFTARGNRERDWSNLSIDQRIAVVGGLSEPAMNLLHWARFAVYRHSSEILHGSFFSALYFLGLTTPFGQPRSSEELGETIGQQHMLVLMAAIMSLSAVVRAFHAAYGFLAAKDRDQVLMASVRAIPYLRESKANSA